MNLQFENCSSNWLGFALFSLWMLRFDEFFKLKLQFYGFSRIFFSFYLLRLMISLVLTRDRSLGPYSVNWVMIDDVESWVSPLPSLFTLNALFWGRNNNVMDSWTNEFRLTTFISFLSFIPFVVILRNPPPYTHSVSFF